MIAAMLLTALVLAQDTSAPVDDGIPRLKPAAAGISAVMVYPDGAVVTRTAKLSVPAGHSVVVFDGLTPTLDEASLVARIPGTTGARVSGISADWAGGLEPAREAEAKLTSALEKIDADIQTQNDALGTLAVRRQVLEQYRALARESIDQQASDRIVPGSSSKWKESVGFMTKEHEALAATERSIRDKLKDLYEQRVAKQAELAKIQAGEQRKTRRVEVELEADHAVETSVSMDYQVPGAGWYPAYDARQTGDGPAMNLVYYGTVVQQTGEDWDSVALTLSTARPAEGAQVPTLLPVLLSGYKREKQPITIVSYGKEREKSFKDGAKVDQSPDQAGRATVDDHGTAITFAINGKESIAADHRPHKVEITTLNLTAKLAYEAVPKVAPWVFLKATASNSSAFPILAGEVNVFRSSGYIGSSHLDYIAPGEELSVSLGVDDDLKVRRVIDERVDRKPKLLGTTRTLAYGYEIEVENYKKDPQTITIVENIPVSQRKEIKIGMRDGTTRPDATDDDGFLKWNVPLDPGAKKTIDFGYTVEYPQSFNIEGL